MFITEKEVLYEDNHYIVINKKAGDLVQGDSTGDLSLDKMTKIFLAEKYKKPNGAFLGVAHRLDRPVSGIVLFAKTSKGLERINRMFKERTVQKIYWAVVRNKPSRLSDTLVHWLIKNPKKNITTAYSRETKGALRSELEYKVKGTLNGYFLLEINLITGRPHQIRAQLAAVGCPIVGDNKYGYPRGSTRRSICLHARCLSFVHPIRKETVSINAALPKDGFWEKFESLG